MTIRPTLDELSMADELLMQAEATYGYLPRVSAQRSEEASSDAEETVAVEASGASWDDRQPLAG